MMAAVASEGMHQEAAHPDEEYVSTLPWILACQQDSYLFDFDTTVVKCMPLSEWAKLYSIGKPEGDDEGAKKKKKKKKKKVQAEEESAKTGDVEAAKFGVVLSNTVFFPTGGGQPHDTGHLSYIDNEGSAQKVPVVNVQRIGPGGKIVLHYTTLPVPCDPVPVTCEVNQNRRKDHMSQHTGQHLITAIALKEYSWKTLSWNLTAFPKPCYLDLAANKINSEQLGGLEQAINEQILESHSITPSIMEREDFADGGVRHHAKGINASNEMPMRVVTIDGVDKNACCGTHMQSTGHLQAIKLLYTEKGKEQNSTRVWFVAGSRVLQRLGELNETSRKLTSVLTCPSQQHASRVEEILGGVKESGRTEKNLLRTIASLNANVTHHPELVDGIVYFHLEEGTPDFMKSFLRAAKEAVKEYTSNTFDCLPEDGFVYLVSIGSNQKPGAFMLEGAAGIVPLVGKALAAALGNARGGGKGGRFQAKIEPGVLREKTVLDMHTLARRVVIEARESNAV
jgi:misacylated tRNA(Ala) deacylase